MANPDSVDDCWPTEAEYLRYLAVERRMFAWCLTNYGGYSEAVATEKAEARYPYEPPEQPYRGILFHDLAWHWAMLELHGRGYWWSRPELGCCPETYHQESDQLHRAQ